MLDSSNVDHPPVPQTICLLTFDLIHPSYGGAQKSPTYDLWPRKGGSLPLTYRRLYILNGGGRGVNSEFCASIRWLVILGPLIHVASPT